MTAQRQRPDAAFPWLSAARTYYQGAFGVRTKAELGASMAEWDQLTESEQRFVQAHLAWLTLEALGSLRGQAVRVANGIGDLVELGQAVEVEEEAPPSALVDEDDVVPPLRAPRAAAPPPAPADLVEAEVLLPGEAP